MNFYIFYSIVLAIDKEVKIHVQWNVQFLLKARNFYKRNLHGFVNEEKSLWHRYIRAQSQASKGGGVQRVRCSLYLSKIDWDKVKCNWSDIVAVIKTD